MPIELTTQETADAIHSLKKYFSSELDSDLSDLRAKLLLDYLLKDIGPLAYNRGLHDAEEFFRKRLEDLPAACFEPPFTYWQGERKNPQPGARANDHGPHAACYLTTERNKTEEFKSEYGPRRPGPGCG